MPTMLLAGPRRTGKSHFLRHDLLPQLAARGFTTVYVDLWAKRGAEPAGLIAAGIAAALKAASSPVARAARRVGVTKIDLAGVAAIEFERIGAADGVSFTDALSMLAARADKPVALVVDEAQDALNSSAGLAAMFALKAARDAMNQGADAPGLALVMTGSHRDKLANLALRRSQPFYGTDVTEFPLLGRAYTDAFTDWVNARLAPGNAFSRDVVHRAFQALGHRPEQLWRLIQDAAFAADGAAGLDAQLASGANALKARLWAEYDREVGELTRLQRAILDRLIATGPAFQPFAAESLAAYRASLGAPVGASDAQAALDGLREKGVVWRHGRGGYALEDAEMADWHAARTNSQLRPDE